MTGEGELTGSGHFQKTRFNSVRVDGVGCLSKQPENHTFVGPVPLSGGTQRPIELGTDSRYKRQHLAPFQGPHEHQCCAHWANCM